MGTAQGDDHGQTGEITPAGALNTTASDPRKWICLVAMLLAVSLRVGYWVGTQRTWEDALITVRHAENAAQGRGLTHHPGHGQLVHGFTSAISVLIPLAGELVVPGSGVPVQKGVSVIMALVCIGLGYRIATHPTIQLSWYSTAFFLGFLAIDHQQILFGMAGMETQCVVTVTLLLLQQYLEGRTIAVGLVCGLALWARPDGVVIAGPTIALALLQWGWKRALLVAVLCVATIAPWLIFTTIYYGSPVPHTIIAKKVGAGGDTIPIGKKSPAETIRELVGRANNLRIWLSPAFSGAGGPVNHVRGARPLQALYAFFLLVGILGWSDWRKASAIVTTIGLAYTGYFWLVLPLAASWYTPPWLAVMALIFAGGVDRVAAWNPASLLWQKATACVSLGYLALYAYGLVGSFPADAIIQRGVEEHVRTNVGRWLDEHAGPDDWIGVECLGYVGYYANRPMLDFPGLSSPRSVAAQRRHGGGLTQLIAYEQPEWIVLRPHEWTSLAEYAPPVAARYELRTTFKADEADLAALDWWLGLSGQTLSIDKEFGIWQRQGPVIPFEK